MTSGGESAYGTRQEPAQTVEGGSRAAKEKHETGRGARPRPALPDAIALAPRADAVQRALDDSSPGRLLDADARAQVPTGTDVSGVRVHTDGAAARLAADVDADAFTRGSHVYFGAGRYEPATETGRHLLRHELGHVAQQARGELSAHAGWIVPAHHASEAEASSGAALRGAGVVADAAGVTVQRQPTKPALSKDDAPFYLWVLDDVLYYPDTTSPVRDLTGRYRAPFEQLLAAVTGKDLQGRKIPDRHRRESFDAAVLALRDVLAYASDAQRAALARQRTALFETEAEARIESDVVVVGDRAIEIPDDRHPHEQAEVLRHELLPKLVETLMLANEQLHRLAEANHEHYELAIEAIEHSPAHKQLKELLQQVEHDARPAQTVVETIGALQALLAAADGWLTLTDVEFQEHLRDVHKFMPGVASFTELVKVIVEIGIGSVSLTAALAAGLARAVGDTALALDALTVAGKAGGVLANAVAGIEIVHGLFVLFDPDASREKKEEAAVSVASGSAWFIGSRVGGFVAGASASVAVIVPYLMFKEAMALYWGAALGIDAALAGPVFEYMQRAGESMARVGDRVASAALLFANEHDPRKARPLAALLAQNEDLLAGTLDQFLHEFSPEAPREKGMRLIVPMLNDAFAPLQRFRGVKSGPALAIAVAHVLPRIAWCLRHANEIVAAATLRKDLSEVVDPGDVRLAPRASREDVLKEFGVVDRIRIEFRANGYGPEDATVVKTIVPGLDVLWYLTGTNQTLTLADLAAPNIVMEGEAVGGYPVRFVRDAAGKLSYDDVPSFTGDYFRLVAKSLGLGAKTMHEESFAGMVRVYAHLIGTPLNDASVRGG